MGNLLEMRFRVSMYGTLLLATLCLGHAEEAFLPGIGSFIALVVMLQLTAFLCEGHWALSMFAANILGMLIAIGAGLWITYEVNQPNDFIQSAPFPAMYVPYIGPILMVAMLGMLFCPKKIRELWVLHLIGFIEVTLASVLASEPVFGPLLLAYLMMALWSLMLFFLKREQTCANAAAPRGGVNVRACGWAVAALVLAYGLFLSTPQFSDAHWDPFHLARVKSIESGFTNTIDLNRTGQLKLSNEVAFEVTAHNADGTPKVDLNDNQRFRGQVLDRYDRGQWLGQPAAAWVVDPMNFRRMRARRGGALPDLGPSQFFLTFRLDLRRSLGLFLAEPVSAPHGRAPVATIPPGGLESWVFQPKDGVLSADPIARRTEYQQVMVPHNSIISAPLPPGLVRESDYLQQPLPRLRTWTIELLQTLLDRGQIVDDDLTLKDAATVVPSERRAKVAMALSEYLASSGHYVYSLDLRRKDRSMDPIEDFLINVRQGHCERYASALALMLRSCGIPARIVVGFQGLEHEENDAHYFVRESSVHSWVEALIQKKTADGTIQQHWLSLDPTPGGDAGSSEESSWFERWSDMFSTTSFFWRKLLVEYNADEQRTAVTGLQAAWQQTAPSFPVLRAALWPATLLLAVPCAWFVYRRLRGQRAHAPRRTPFAFPAYERLLRLLERHVGLTPAPAQTPREFAAAAADALQARQLAAFVSLPVQLATLLYRVRYGNRPLSEDEQREIDQQVQHFELGLVSSR